MASDCRFYFAYGSNMDARRMAERDVRFEGADPALLRNYRLCFNKRSISMAGSGAANVVPSRGDRVEGVLYRLRDDDEIVRLDPFEGYPDGYRREVLEVETGNDAKSGAWVYLANDHYIDETLKPRRAYLDHLLAGKPFLSPAYYTRLARVECEGEG